MKKLIKWLLGLVLILAVVLILVVVLLPVIFDPNEHKSEIQTAASNQVGREIQLNGPIEWSVFPWVAINLNDVVVGNEKGFKGSALAEVEQVSVRVKLLPLLSKQIQIGKVELVKPVINLQIAQSGLTNWQSMLSHSESSGEQDNNQATDLEIKGIVISQGRVNYTDAATNIQLEMIDVSFKSDAIQSGVATEMSLKTVLNLPAQELKSKLDSTWTVKNLTTGSGPQFNFTSFDIDGQIGLVPLKLSSQGQMNIDLAKDTLDIERLIMDYSVARMTTPVKGTGLAENISLSGNLAFNEFSLADLLADVGTSFDNQANNAFAGNTDWSLVGDRLQLNQMNFSLDESKISGSVDIKQLSQLKGQFNIDINQMNADEYLPVESSGTTTATSGDAESAAMDLGQMKGQIKMSQLQIAGVKMSDITLNVQTRGKDFTIEPLNAGFYQGLIKTKLIFQPENRTEKLQVTHQMSDFQAGGMLTDLMGTDYLTGLGQLNADIKIDEPFSDRPFKTANGTLSYQLSDGDIVGIDVFQIMQKSLSLLNKADVVTNSEELKTAFGLMDIQALVTNGILQTKTLKITSPYFNLTGDVEIDLDQQTIRGNIKPMLTNIPEGVLDKNFEKLLNLRIPVKLRGKLLSPDVSIDIEQLILESQKTKINEKKEALKEDLFDALLGSKKEKTNQENEGDDKPGEPELTDKQKKKAEKDRMKRELLKGLLGGGKEKDKKDKEIDETDGGN